MTTATDRRSRILNISVPPDMYEEIVAAAEAEDRTKSELMREAFRHYQFVRRWRLIRQWGAQTTIEFGIENEEQLEEFLG